MTGVTTKNSQHFCAILGEYGADSAFPGAQFFSASTTRARACGRARARSVAESGHGEFHRLRHCRRAIAVQPGADRDGDELLFDYATHPPTSRHAGFVTFTTTVNPGFIPGSEFTVSGVSPIWLQSDLCRRRRHIGDDARRQSAQRAGRDAAGHEQSWRLFVGRDARLRHHAGMQVMGSGSNQLLGRLRPFRPMGHSARRASGGVGTYGLTNNQPTTSTFTAAVASGDYVATHHASATHAHRSRLSSATPSAGPASRRARSSRR